MFPDVVGSDRFLSSSLPLHQFTSPTLNAMPANFSSFTPLAPPRFCYSGQCCQQNRHTPQFVFSFSRPTVRAVDPFGQVFRPTGVELPGWDFAFLAVGLSGYVKCVGLTLEGSR